MSHDGSVERQRANERRSATQKQNAKRRKLTAKWDIANAIRAAETLPPARVLVAWHTDETGCRARVVGCDA